MESVAPQWKEIAIALGYDGAKIQSIEMGSHFQPEEACRRVFMDWLNGDHDCCKPITWATVIQCLHEADHSTVAEELQRIIQAVSTNFILGVL